MKVIDMEPVPMATAKEIMESKEGELGYEQKLALEHLRKFTKLDKEKAEKLAEELSGILRMSKETLMQIVNLLPTTPDEVRMLFAKERFSLKEEEIAKIIETVKKYI
ncbi:MAG: DNA-directed RNA polymerase subunit F [Candidatus Micrarchaeota archaeon]|nr:DNA-directed RNA polymerase subunit F [Candidatus Micrarchaeota archaeon]